MCHRLKIKDFNDKIHFDKEDGKKIVLCNGIFNSLHIGHIRYLKQAKSLGDILVVSLTADEYIIKTENIQFHEDHRYEALKTLEFIDYVIINPYKNVIEFLEKLKPDVFVKGFESVEKGVLKDNYDSDICEKLGIKLVVAKENDFTTTKQINRYLGSLPVDIQKYLDVFKKRNNKEIIINAIKKMSETKVLIIGDTILDEYHYCSAIGKSSKDPTLALKYQSHDLFAGGILAIANHVAQFSENVDLITVLGQIDSKEDFIREKIDKKIGVNFLEKNNAPTIIKRRFIDGYSMNKLLEVYIMDDSELTPNIVNEMNNMITSKISEYDLVIVADFGHGSINHETKKLISEKAPFLALNAQSNAGNRGFNNITKYPRADFVSMAEHEIRLEMRDLSGEIWPMLNLLSKKMNTKKFIVTRGRKGCMVGDSKEGGFIQVPSFAQKIVDRVGAGDAFFSLTSLAAVQNLLSSEVIGFLGNACGSLAVEIMGNEKSINRNKFLDYVNTLLS